MIGLVALSPAVIVFTFLLVMFYIFVDGIHQNHTNPAQRQPVSEAVHRRRTKNIGSCATKSGATRTPTTTKKAW